MTDHAKIAEILESHRPLVTASAADTVKQTLETLSKNNFTALPLFKFPLNKFEPFVACLDLAFFLVEIATKAAKGNPNALTVNHS